MREAAAGDGCNLGLIHEAVSSQAAQRPDDMALSCGDERVSYATLDAAADWYAAQLSAHGVGSGSVVPLVVRKSASLAALLLGVLKTGAAYAALDPRWPLPRIRAVIDATRPPVVIADAALQLENVALWTPPAEPVAATAAHGSRFSRVEISTSAPASVFFTSGSTGVPKGIVSPHRATTRMFRDAEFAAFGPGRRMAQIAPVPWDAFSLELWGMLTTGGTCVMHAGDYFLPDHLRMLIGEHGVDTLFVTTSLFNLFVEEDPHCFTGLRQLMTGGERASIPAFKAFRKHHPEVALIHCYGPAEACIFTTAHRVREIDERSAHGIPIGVPVPQTGVHILDERGELPRGEQGEIYVSGDGLALGYLGDEALSASRFISVTVGDQVTRVYRTGDLGVIDRDGVLHFAGRADRQLKIAGHRVEPDDIETVARGLPGVSQAAVMPMSDDSGRAVRLVLFFVPAGPTGGSKAVRRALAEQLPRYLVPDTILELDRFPLNANGKLDRAALLDRVEAPAIGRRT